MACTWMTLLYKSNSMITLANRTNDNDDNEKKISKHKVYNYKQCIMKLFVSRHVSYCMVESGDLAEVNLCLIENPLTITKLIN